MAHHSVLIAGAGPSGLILALVLLQNGVSVRIIDKEPKHRIGSRGTAIQPRTLELYDIIGILPEIQNEGEFLPSIAIYNPGELKPATMSRLAEWVEPTPDVPHANMISVSQERHEEILRGQLQKFSCFVELGTELLGFEQFPDHVVAHIVKTDAKGKQLEEHTKFDWLVGTDGARSIVRKQLGLSFLGETRTEQSIALGDIVVEEGVEPTNWHMWSVPPKFIALRSTNSTSKVFMFALTGLPEQLAEKTLTREEFIEEFYALTKRTDIKFGEATWLSNYRPNMRMVDRLREGRVFIAGDAAHCHSPTGGQGLNSSVQDVANLGWKLALVQKGLAPPELLDTYSEERIRVIAHMLNLTTELYNATFDQLHRKGIALDDASFSRGGDMRMLGINYRGSSIISEDAGGAAEGASNAYAKADGARVQAAYRAPDAPGLVRVGSGSASAPTSLFTVFRASVHTVLLFGGDAAARAPVASILARIPADLWNALLVLSKGQETASDAEVFSSVLVDASGHAYGGYGVGTELTIVVVRPDGVVGAVAADAAGVQRYFQKILSV
ncbi:FAD binding domain-containing protein [Mycena galericulata]|nr:FAD binding domain-containing protein [Mycena galericulata]